MQNADIASIIEGLQRVVAALRHGQQVQAESLSTAMDDNSVGAQGLPEHVAASIAPHLQIKPLPSADRKRVLGKYQRFEPFPKVLKDANGLAAKAIGDAKERKWILNNMATLQKDALEITRIAAAACSKASLMSALARHTVLVPGSYV